MVGGRRRRMKLDLACPVPLPAKDRVLLGHGSGGRLSAELLRAVFLPALGNPVLDRLEDQAVCRLGAERVAVTTDSFVVKPLFFPGGDIGSLSVHGTINDLAVGGAKPLFLSAAFIIEEGFPIADLTRIAESLARAASQAGVAVVTGDTKVVERGAADGLFITTTGVGIVPEGIHLSAANARPGDRVLLSGSLGDHGIAIMAHREGLEFECLLETDSAPLDGLAAAMLAAEPGIRAMRDPTRGGLASTLNEIAAQSRAGIRIAESALPIKSEVRGACEMLGLDPLYVANEGKLVAIVPPESAERVLEVMRQHQFGNDAAIIGEVTEAHPGRVLLETAYGTTRIVDMLSGDQLPRIC
jgi:hydrogenase expression/formation protein HypE